MKKLTLSGLLKGFLMIAISLVALLSETNEIKAVNIVYESETEENYADTYKGISYHKITESPVNDEEADGVDLATGQLSLMRNDLYLEGNGGMDFSLTRYYHSNEADLGLVTVEQKAELSNDVHYISFTGEDGKTHKIRVAKGIYDNHSKALTDMFYTYKKGEDYSSGTLKDTQVTKIINRYPYHVYGLGVGWSFDLPWIETTSVKEGEKRIGRSNRRIFILEVKEYCRLQ